jgi:hypothetical protein
MHAWLTSLEHICTIGNAGAPTRSLWTKPVCDWFAAKMEVTHLCDHLAEAPNGPKWHEAYQGYLATVRREAVCFADASTMEEGYALIVPAQLWMRVVEWVDSKPRWPLLVPNFWTSFAATWEIVERACLEVRVYEPFTTPYPHPNGMGIDWVVG